MALAHRGKGALGEVQLPVRGEVAAVLVGVAVADHHRLPSSAGREMAGVGRVREEALEGVRGGVQVGDGLEERHHVEAVRDPGVLRHQEDREQVARPPGHADDVGLDRGRTHAFVGPSRQPEEVEGLVRGVAEVEAVRGERAAGQDLAGQEARARASSGRSA